MISLELIRKPNMFGISIAIFIYAVIINCIFEDARHILAPLVFLSLMVIIFYSAQFFGDWIIYSTRILSWVTAHLMLLGSGLLGLTTIVVGSTLYVKRRKSRLEQHQNFQRNQLDVVELLQAIEIADDLLLYMEMVNGVDLTIKTDTITNLKSMRNELLVLLDRAHNNKSLDHFQQTRIRCNRDRLNRYQNHKNDKRPRPDSSFTASPIY